MAPEPTDAVLIHLEYIRASIDGVTDRLDKLNGKTDRHEQAIADHRTELAVLKDRSDDAKNEGRKWGAGAGAIGTLVGAALGAWFNK